MKEIFLGLGSNIGNRMDFLQKAVQAIAGLADTRVRLSSSVYATEPVGSKDQPEFLNAVLEIESEMSPGELLRSIRDIEMRLGRTHATRWGPREIDIDILYFGSRVIDEENLRVPHPEIRNRRFVLQPLAEIAPDFRDPGIDCTVAELLESCQDKSAVVSTTWKVFDSSWEHLSAGRQQRDTTHRH